MDEQYYKTLVENVNSVVMRFDKEGIVHYINQFGLEHFGFTADEILESSLFDTIVPEKESTGRYLNEFLRDMEQHPKRFINHTNQNKKADGSRVWTSWTNKVIYDENGNAKEFLSIGQDITEKKELEEANKNLQKQLEMAQNLESLGNLAGGIAHDFNNSLMGIQGNTSLAKQEIDSDSPVQERLEKIEDLVKNSADIIQELLGFARGGQYKISYLNPNSIIDKTLNTFAQTNKQITINMGLDDMVSGIKADPSQLQRILMNIFVNASDAMPQGGNLSVKTKNLTYDDKTNKTYTIKPGNYINIEITDDGIGMDSHTIERIFDPFYTTKEVGKGTGLGLASTWGIVKKHEGYIDVDSQVGKGTTFNIYLPAANKPKKDEDEKAEKVVNGKGTVLLVDDEDVIRDVGKSMLEHLGYKVYMAVDGYEAIERYKELKDDIDLIILDIIMPKMTGPVTFDILKNYDPDVRVMVSSGFSIDSDAKEMLENGCREFIQKPYSMESLSVKVNRSLYDN